MIVPAQLSFASGLIVTDAEHSPVISGNVFNTGAGAALPLIITFCFCIVIFPLPSS